jgi:hypothetical protein
MLPDIAGLLHLLKHPVASREAIQAICVHQLEGGESSGEDAVG